MDQIGLSFISPNPPSQPAVLQQTGLNVGPSYTTPPNKSFKSMLIEMYSQYYKSTSEGPVFKIGEEGNPQAGFNCTLTCPCVDTTAEGRIDPQVFQAWGRSKKGAEHAAAEKALMFFQEKGVIEIGARAQPMQQPVQQASQPVAAPPQSMQIHPPPPTPLPPQTEQPLMAMHQQYVPQHQAPPLHQNGVHSPIPPSVVPQMVVPHMAPFPPVPGPMSGPPPQTMHYQQPPHPGHRGPQAMRRESSDIVPNLDWTGGIILGPGHFSHDEVSQALSVYEDGEGTTEEQEVLVRRSMVHDIQDLGEAKEKLIQAYDQLRTVLEKNSRLEKELLQRQQLAHGIIRAAVKTLEKWDV